MEKNDNILDQTGNKRPFSVPENYFEDFAVNIERRISSKKKVVTVPLFQKIKPYLYAAAMFAGILLVGDYLMMKTNPQDKMLVASEIVIPFMEQSDLLLSYVDESTLIEFLIENE